MLTSKVSATGPNVKNPPNTEKKENWGNEKEDYKKAFDETKSPWERVTDKEMESKGTKNPAKAMGIIGMKKCDRSGPVGVDKTTGLGMFLTLFVEVFSIVNFIVYVSMVLQACYPVFNKDCWPDEPNMEAIQYYLSTEFFMLVMIICSVPAWLAILWINKQLLHGGIEV